MEDTAKEENNCKETEKNVSADQTKDKKSRGKNGKMEIFTEKEFIVRNSILTEKLSLPDNIIIYNMFFTILVSLLINTVINDYIKSGEINFGQKLIKLAFNNMHLGILVWLVFNVFVYVSYSGFLFWAKIRIQMLPKSTLALIWDKIWLAIAIIYFIFLFYFAQKMMNVCGFAPGSCMTLLAEQVRLVMKQYAFLRANVPKILNFKPHSEKDLRLPTLHNVAYFTFAPVLIYRDEYPRSKTINWKFAFKSISEVFGIILFLSLLCERYLRHSYNEYCLRKFTWEEMVLTTLTNLFPGIMFMLLGFYAVIHSTQNAFAEILRFGDREFYQEWWQCRSFSRYLRTWNIIVQDWLYQHIYLDSYRYLMPKNKICGMLLVFLVSAAVHEWIISVSFGIFLPVQSAQLFLSGAILTSLGLMGSNMGNIALWYFIALGAGIQISFYSMEFFARTNCPIEDGWIEFMKPRFLTCDCYL